MSSQPSINTPDVAQKLSAKMSGLASDAVEKEVAAQASTLNLSYLDLRKFHVAQEVLQMVPEDTAQNLKLVPIVLDKNILQIGVINPDAVGLNEFLDKLKADKMCKISLYLVSSASFEHVIKGYAGLPKVKPISTGVNITHEELAHYDNVATDFKKLAEVLKTANLTDIINILIAGALELSASDIHVEATEKNIIIRYRLDGVLHDVSTIAPEHWKQLISRLKLIARLKLNINSEPQDGRFTINLENDKVDVRVSTIPTAWGESVVMRLLRSSAAGLKFEDLGLRGKAYEVLKKQTERPHGMIIATGPTGSGKTTTLYAVLNKLNDEETKIITLEDPVEYKLQGINQSQIDHSTGYDFAKGLRAILRQDPDIVMVGEIRDIETADIAVNAALTGHLVISTIHTNSAAGAIPRFLAMAVKPFLLAPALNCVIGQRLVRKICTNCKAEIKLEIDTLNRVKNILSALPKNSGYGVSRNSAEANPSTHSVRSGFSSPSSLLSNTKDSAKENKIDLNNLKFYQGTGCAACHNLGYKGRIGIYEIMEVTVEIEKMILTGTADEIDIEKVAVTDGMITMVQDGLLKALDGTTSVAEVFTVAE